MAINKEVFRVRALSSLFFVIAMMAGLLWNHWTFLLLFSVIHFGCWWEYSKLIGRIHQSSFHVFTRLGMAITGFAIMLAFCGKAYQLAGYGIRQNFCFPLSVAGFLLMVIGVFKQTTPVKLPAFFGAAAGWIYISLSWGLMLSLRQENMLFKGNSLFLDGGRTVPLLLILAIWGNDTFAYLVGSMIGKTPFSKISPKKTWEGTAGGALLCIVGMGTLGSWLVTGTMGWLAVWIACIAAVIGTLGDLFESKLKRMAGVKDSGNMLPGHGGFMDRFDSLLFATPFVWLLVRMLKGF
jgi:phosphatidate cytidylyltransferase